MSNPSNAQLLQAESGISSCENYSQCNGSSACDLTLSSIEPGHERRGSRDPRILIITEAPDKTSSEGTAYSGGLSNRLISIFCNEEYGIGLSREDVSSFPEFLKENRIYATSAVKCFVDGKIGNIGNYVISQCGRRYLNNQIEALDNLELMIPMGNVAAASVTGQSLSSTSIISCIGNHQQGIFPDYTRHDASMVMMPHPSGNNLYANPPVINSSGNPKYWGYKIRFRKALLFIRDKLNEIGYDVFRKSPSSWDEPPGLSDFM